MEADSLDIRLLRFRSRRDESAQELAQALLEASRPADALEVVHAGLAEHEDDPGLLILEGRAWYEQGDLPRAQAVLLKAAKVSPRNKEPYRWLAQVLMKRGEPHRAVQVLERAMQLDPSDRSLSQSHARAERLARIAFDAEAVPPAPSPKPPEPRAAPEPSPRAPAPSPKPPEPRAAPEPSPRAAALSAKPPEPTPRAAAPGLGVHDVRQPPAASRPMDAFSKEPATRPADVASAAIAGRSMNPSARVPPPAGSRKPPSFDAPRAASAMAARVSAPAPAAPLMPIETTREVDALLRQEDDEPTRSYGARDEVDPYLDDAPSQRGRATAPRQLLDALATSPDNDDDEPTLIGESRSLIAEARRAAEPETERESVPSELAPSSIFIDPELQDHSPFHSQPPFVITPDRPGEPEPPEQVLEMLATQGVFEPPQEPERAMDWVRKRDAGAANQRVGRGLAVGWVLALAAAGGGYYGFTRYVETRRADAKVLIGKAGAEALEGDVGALRDAERHLIEARELDPKADAALEGLLFVHAARALEAGGDVGYLRGTIARAEQGAVYKPMIGAARAVVFAYDRDPDRAQREIDASLQKGGDDPRVLYLIGRLRQRIGATDAEPLLVRATEKGPDLALAWLARAELLRQAAQPDEARELFVKALGKDGQQLRAELWIILLDAQAGRDPALLPKLDGLAERVKVASPPDKLLEAIARATVLLADTQVEAARAVIHEASKLRADDPELLSLLADRAARVGEHDLAYRAANAAVVRAPSNRRYRDALADVLLKRGDGPAVLAALQGIDDGSTWILLTRARAALLSGTREALEEAKRTLSAHRATERGRKDDDAAALLLRVDLRLGANAESLRAAAKALASKSPDSPLAQLALGENYVLSERGDAALGPLEKARALGSDDADLFALLGRAYRQTGQPEKALKAFQHALELAPSHVEAREALGSFLLDRGDFARAEGLFAALEKERASLAASLGVIEALLGRGEVAAAKERFAALSEDRRSLPAVIAVGARVAIADKHPNEAVKMLEPLVAEEAEQRTADIFTLYGDALYAANLVDSAAGAYEDALELDESYPDALVGRAMAAMRAEKVAQSFELLDRAEAALKTRIRPEVLHALLKLTRAKGFIHKQEFSRAQPLLSEAVGVAGAPAETHFWFAEMLAKTKTPGASEHYAKYVELEPHGEYAARAQRALAPR